MSIHSRPESSRALSSLPASRPDAAGPSHDGDRRRFLGTLASFVVAGLAVHIVGCTRTDPVSSGTPAPEGGDCALGKAAVDRSGDISSNHGHEAVVTTAQQDAETAFDLNIMGSSGHNHTISLTSQDLADLKAGTEVVKTSSNVNGHAHTVTFAAMVTGIRPC